MKRIVVALGGNAILTDDSTAQGQKAALSRTAQYLVEFVKQGYQIIISHGNGSQVGNILLQQAAADSPKNPDMPLDTCVAMTRGSIGYWLQNELQKALKEAKIDQQVVSLVTQIVVDANDPAFDEPTKPIGPFLTQEQAASEAAETGHVFKEDAGRGYRRVVPSPKPQDILEADVIRTLLDNNCIVIAAGGGGVPVVASGQAYEGIEAVIDKYFTFAKLAELVEADSLIILTGVDHAYLDFNQPNQTALNDVTVAQMREYISAGEFAPGSMLPKVEVSIQFVEQTEGAPAVITSLDNIENYLHNGTATIIRR